MEALFKFAHIRPPKEPDARLSRITLANNSAFQQKLSEALTGTQSRRKMKEAAAKYLKGPQFIQDSTNLRYGRELEALSGTLATLEKSESLDYATVDEAIKRSFGKTSKQLATDNEFATELEKLSNSLVAIKLLPEQHRRPVHHLAGALRDLSLIKTLAQDDASPASGALLRRYRRRGMALPDGVALGSVLKTPEREAADPDAHRKEFDKKLSRFGELQATVDELTRVDGQKFVQSSVKLSKGVQLAKALRPISLLENALEKGYSPYLSPLQSALFRPVTRSDASSAVSADDNSVLLRSAMLDATAPKLSLDTAPLMPRTSFVGRVTFEPTEPKQRSFRLTPEAGRALSKGSQAVLKARALDVTDQPVDEVVSSLQAEVATLGASLEVMADPGSRRSFKRMGSTMVMINTPIATPWVLKNIGHLPGLMFPMPDFRPLDMRVPHSHGDVKPIGVADLLVVKQQLKGYEARDVAHIENVLLGESKERIHRRRNETEEFAYLETEKTTTEERDLQSTDRFEMSRETSNTIQEDASLKAGMTISAKYGPAVEFSASVEGSFSRSKTEATKAASNFSKEITQRSATKISERVLEKESRKIITEIEETNTHRLNNEGGTGHVRGVYQWVEKVYEAQVYNYGLRTMFDFMVPEPGAFLIEALRRAHVSATELTKPTPFDIRPDQITEYNYHSWVSLYGATDIDPPPEPYITKTHDYSAGGGDDKTDYNHSSQIQIDEGYRAIYATVGVVGNTWEDNASVDVIIGQRANRIEDAGIRVWHTGLDNEVLAIPFAMNTFRQSDVAIALEVKCQRTDRALAKWRHETHAKLTTAHRARLAEYEEKLAALKVEAGIAIEGMSPALNLEIMTDEFKKACITLMTEQHFDLFDAIDAGSNGLPQINLHENEAEGPYVRFFEQAFEWEQMTWLTYPYFWGRKSQWTDRIAMEDADPIFNQFLKAGYCRVVVPLRPGFEGAVDHFMNFGEPWMGGPLPPITSDLYLPIADEIAERLDRPGDEFPEGEPWEVRFPTSLVRLRDDGSLPSWEKNAAGEWKPSDQ